MRGGVTRRCQRAEALMGRDDTEAKRETRGGRESEGTVGETVAPAMARDIVRGREVTARAEVTGEGVTVNEIERFTAGAAVAAAEAVATAVVVWVTADVVKGREGLAAAITIDGRTTRTTGTAATLATGGVAIVTAGAEAAAAAAAP